MARLRQLTGIASPAGRLVYLRTNDDGELHLERKLFSSKQSAVHRYSGSGDAVVVKRVRDSDRVREEHAAINLLRRNPIPGFVPTVALRNGVDGCFVDAGRSCFVMPHLGNDMLTVRERTIHTVCPGRWADVVVGMLGCVARTLLALWVHTGATYYDVKARNILAVVDLVETPQPFTPDHVLLCDIGSINSPCATHHPPTAVMMHLRGEGRHCAYAAWGLACTLLELLHGSELPRQLRNMRKNETSAPLADLRAGLEHVDSTLGDYPEAQSRVANLSETLLRAITMRQLTLQHLLDAVTVA